MSDPVAIITGGTRGIGAAIAQALAERGFALALCGLRAPEEVHAMVTDLDFKAYKVSYFQCDISDSRQRKRMVNDVHKRFGRIDTLVNNAGVAPSERLDILEATEESFSRVLRINLQGPYFLTQQVARKMLEQELGSVPPSVINISSVSAFAASLNRGEYCISKAGLSMASRLWALRLAPFGISVFEIQPGIIRTDMTSSVADKYDRLIEQGLVPEGRWGRPEDVGRVAAAMAVGDLPYATGQTVVVDGGMTIPRL